MAYAEFYVTKGASAADTNGGGPNLGANDGPVLTLTNVDAVDIGGGLFTLENKDNTGWSTTAVDDYVCWDTAGTKEFARVTGLAVGDDSDVISVYPMVSITPGVGGKTVNVGGAWATVDFAASNVTINFRNAAGDGPRVNVKYNAAAYEETVTMDSAGTTAIPIVFEGYETTAGDGCPNGNRPSISTTDHLIVNARNFIYVRNFALSTATNSKYCIYNTGAYCYFVNCTMTASAASAVGFYSSGGDCFVLNCISQNCGGYGYRLSTHNVAIGCQSLHNGGYGMYFASSGIVVAHCILHGNADDNIYTTGCPSLVINNVLDGSTGGSGFRTADPTNGTPLLFGNVITDNNQYGIECSAAAACEEDYNALRGNGVAARLNVVTAGAHDVTLTADPYVAAGTNFALNATAGGGAACRAAGFPGTLAGGVNIGYTDIGALQHEDAGAGGGAVRIGVGGRLG